MKKVIFYSLAILISLTLLASQVLAGKDKSAQKIVVLPKDEVINEDYFAFGDTVTISGTVNGDVYAAGGRVLVEGIINGDLLAAGGDINVRGTVSNDVRVVGGQITISGEVGGNLTSVGGGAVNINDSAKISGSLVAGSGALSLFSPIGKGATLGVGDAIIGSTINGNVKAGVGQLTLSPNSQINGNLTYWSDVKAQIQEGAQIEGETIHNLPPLETKKEGLDIAGKLKGINLALKLISLVSAFIIGLLLIKLFPRHTQNTADSIVTRPLPNLGMGLLAIILTPILFIILAITIVGIPIAIILLITLFVTIYFSKIYVALAFGQKALNSLGQKAKSVWALLLGLIIYGVITLIPVIGQIIIILTVLAGTGAILIEKKRTYTQLKSKNLL